ncbi:hypothetical protein [Bradyrhizobium sp. STM 3557]|uniref:hypothetical protein n=1 Tax=Bradyrhizobium sp. STM 3557 TaxID=578920 RepID=UPI00388F343A
MKQQLQAQADAATAADNDSEAARRARESQEAALRASGVFGAIDPGTAPASGTTFTRTLFGQ